MVTHRVMGILHADFGVPAIAAGGVEHQGCDTRGIGLESDRHQVAPTLECAGGSL